jgi:hypothetical protein
VQEDLAIAIGQAAIDGVAAHHGNDAGVLRRLVRPQDLGVIVEVERMDVVRERRVQIHQIANHQWLALVARSTPVENVQATFRSLTFVAVICLRVEYRVAA